MGPERTIAEQFPDKTKWIIHARDVLGYYQFAERLQDSQKDWGEGEVITYASDDDPTYPSVGIALISEQPFLLPRSTGSTAHPAMTVSPSYPELGVTVVPKQTSPFFRIKQIDRNHFIVPIDTPSSMEDIVQKQGLRAALAVLDNFNATQQPAFRFLLDSEYSNFEHLVALRLRNRERAAHRSRPHELRDFTEQLLTGLPDPTHIDEDYRIQTYDTATLRAWAKQIRGR